MNYIKNQGYECFDYDEKEIINQLKICNNVILPLPTLVNGKISGTKLTVSELNSLLNKNNKVFYGNLPENYFSCYARSYYSENSFLIKNSRLTAQGVLRLILNNIETDLYLCKALILGFGRCGKSISKLLKSTGIDVTVAARKYNSRVMAENEKLKTITIKDIEDIIGSYNIIINTIPFNILGEGIAEKLSYKNLYIEVASRPYGFDISNTDTYNFKYLLGESLPGKFTPQSAGNYIGQTVLSILEDETDE